MKNKPVIVVSGDPKSTFNEILIKTLKNKILKKKKFPIIIIGSRRLLEKEIKKQRTKINFQNFQNQENLNKNNIYILDIPFDYKNLSLNKKNIYIKKSFDTGLNFLKKDNLLALINGPISKTTFLKGKYSGITEFLAFKTKSFNEVMLIFNKELSVSPITTHIPIDKVTQRIKMKVVVKKIENINNFYKKFLGFKPI